MIFEWDEAKRVSNFAKHGVDFEAVWLFDWESAIQTLDERKQYGEPPVVGVWENLRSTAFAGVHDQGRTNPGDQSSQGKFKGA